MKKRVSEKLFDNILFKNIHRISEEAIQLAKQNHASYVILEGRDIVEIFPDGRRVVLQTIERQNRLKAGKTFKIQ